VVLAILGRPELLELTNKENDMNESFQVLVILYKGFIRRALNLLYYINGSIIDPATGLPIEGVASYTLSEFQTDATIDLTVSRNVEVSNVYSDTDSQPSLWKIVPTATNKRKLVSPYLIYDTIANLQADFPAATYPSVRAMITTLNNIIVRSNGTRYVPQSGRGFMFRGTFGTLSTPTLNTSTGTTSYNFNTGMGTPTIPANILAIGDQLRLAFRTQKHNANATISHKVTLGTAGTNSDAYIWNGTIAITDLIQTGSTSQIKVTSATTFTTNSVVAQTGVGGINTLFEQTTNFNIASAMILSINGSKNSADTLDLLEYELEWVAS